MSTKRDSSPRDAPGAGQARAQRLSGPAPWPLGALAGIGVPVYRAIIGGRNRRFDAGRGVVRFDRVVISIGNLSVGGTGKTPMVGAIVGWLLEGGRRPVIAMRGYAAPRGGPGSESDEAAAYRRMFPEVPVVAQANRTLGLIQHFSREFEAAGAGEADGSLARPTDCIVLDDGFQHRRIARDLDIVLVDATRSPFQDRLLPAGWLREPVGSLARAGAVVITHAQSAAPADVAALDQHIAAVRGRSAEAVVRHAWAGLEIAAHADGPARREDPAWLAGRRVLAVCAIGNPGVFLSQVSRHAGGAPGAEIVLRDHDPYGRATVRRIIDTARAARAEVIITTEKDWSKLRRVEAGAWPCPIARAQLRLEFDRGEADLRARVLHTVNKGPPE